MQKFQKHKRNKDLYLFRAVRLFAIQKFAFESHGKRTEVYDKTVGYPSPSQVVHQLEPVSFTYFVRDFYFEYDFPFDYYVCTVITCWASLIKYCDRLFFFAF